MMKRLILLAAVLVVVSALLGAQGTLMPAPVFTAFDNSGIIASYAKLCTYAAGTSTPQATYSDSGLLSANTNPVQMDASGRATVYLSPTSYKFTLLTAGTDTTCATGSTLWSVDNVNSVPASNGSVDVLGTAGESIALNKAAYLSDGSGSKQAGQWYLADQANPYSSTLNTVAFTTAAVSSGAVGTFRIQGKLSGFTGLTAGAMYYTSVSGAIVTMVPTNGRRVGQADSTTSLDVQTANTVITSAGLPSTSATNGNVLVGRTTDNTFIISSITPGNGITVATGPGTVTVTASYGGFGHTTTTTANPTGTNSGTGLMMGLAGTITPARTGNVQFCFGGYGTSNTDNDGGGVQIRFGTGSAPSNGAALTGTAIGSLQQYQLPASTNAEAPIGYCAHTTGLTVGTAVWYDLGLKVVNGGTASIFNVVIQADEIP